MKKSLKNTSDIPPELILQIMSLMKSKDINEYCKTNQYINKICKENNELIVKYGLMNDLGIKKAPSKNVLKYLLKYPYNTKFELEKIFSYAARDNRADVISFLIENSIEPSNSDKVMNIAIEKDNVNVFKYILDKNLKDEEYDEDSDFELYLTVFFTHSQKIIDYLLRYRSDYVMENIDNFIELLEEKGDFIMSKYLERFASGEDMTKVRIKDLYRNLKSGGSQKKAGKKSVKKKLPIKRKIKRNGVSTKRTSVKKYKSRAKGRL